MLVYLMNGQKVKTVMTVKNFKEYMNIAYRSISMGVYPEMQYMADKDGNRYHISEVDTQRTVMQFQLGGA